MARVATDEEMVSIRFLVSRGFIVIGQGYRYSIVDGWLSIDQYMPLCPASIQENADTRDFNTKESCQDRRYSFVDQINEELADGRQLKI
jgi:hypothetical protein